MLQKPSVGRTVHYVAYGTPGGEFPAGVCRAAVITQVNVLHTDGPVNAIDSSGHLTNVGLFIMNPTGVFFPTNVAYDEGKVPGTWHWPERTE